MAITCTHFLYRHAGDMVLACLLPKSNIRAGMLVDVWHILTSAWHGYTALALDQQ